MVSVEQYSGEHYEDVKLLWEQAFPDDPPWNRADVVIPAKLASQPELFLVALDNRRVVGAALAGYDGHRGWLYSVSVVSDYCRTGIGSQLVRAIEARLEAMGCRKVNLQIRSLNMSLLTFYHSLGYQTDDRISMGRRLPQGRLSVDGLR
jgi:ribosomal protein S18 acetylase RimI-like enzyme